MSQKEDIISAINLTKLKMDLSKKNTIRNVSIWRKGILRALELS